MCQGTLAANDSESFDTQISKDLECDEGPVLKGSPALRSSFIKEIDLRQRATRRSPDVAGLVNATVDEDIPSIPMEPSDALQTHLDRAEQK
ncbi:hypothetical protein FA95DRAFT_749640 [Auriscalpium vulgare]|uniref:Uncharacterized protein n=1 Tax=Auriscalpium vulgare TaxID=40419 RepID=A0ACB8SB92_9AGAM|nr:hypothetical protein FA95DRAFT_749640 [Auriscalpium vulgare]